MLKQTKMKEYPISFQTEMIKAILAGRKTQTRRIVKQCVSWESDCLPKGHPDGFAVYDKSGRQYEKEESEPATLADGFCRYGAPGSILWVRETWCKGVIWDGEGMEPKEYDFLGIPRPENLRTKYFFKADEHDFEWCRPELDDDDPRYFSAKWKPSIHMPKDAARIWLQVEGVRVEWLQNISEEDAEAEGVKGMDPLHPEAWRGPHHFAFARIWRDINGVESWDDNPWVWVVKFRVLSTTGRPSNLKEICAAS